MLFLDTLEVKAAFTPTDISLSNSVVISGNFGLDSNPNVSGSLNNGTGYVTSTTTNYAEGGVIDCCIPMSISGDYAGSVLNRSDSIASVLYLTSFNVTGTDVVSYDSLYLTDTDNNLLSVGVPSGLDSVGWKFSNAASVWSSSGKIYSNYFLHVRINCKYGNLTNHLNGYQVTLTFNTRFYVRNAIDGEIVGDPVIDIGANEKLEDLNETQESIKDTTEDTNSKITDFFGNFFSNLIGVFVPESNYFSNWFTRVNDLLADKLGILYFPFDFIIDTLTTINSNSSTSSGQIIFPEMSFTNSATSETYTLLNRQVINLNDYDVPFTSSENSSLVGTTNFTSLLSIIRLFTGIAFTLALVHLFIDKLHLILRGSERG